MHHYDHRVHAGNAGDVWKHFLLLEAEDCLLNPDGSLIYAESHAGRPEYVPRAPGEWEGGIGKIRLLLPFFRNFCYFDILADLNPLIHTGSARLIYEPAKRKGGKLEVDVWDIDPSVASSWEVLSQALESSGSYQPAKIIFHQGDGFAEVLSWLDRYPSGLPFIDPNDVCLARKLLQRKSGGIVLKTTPDGSHAFYLQFAEAGLEDCM